MVQRLCENSKAGTGGMMAATRGLLTLVFVPCMVDVVQGSSCVFWVLHGARIGWSAWIGVESDAY